MEPPSPSYYGSLQNAEKRPRSQIIPYFTVHGDHRIDKSKSGGTLPELQTPKSRPNKQQISLWKQTVLTSVKYGL